MHGFLFNFVCTFLHEFNIGGAWVAWRGMAWWKTKLAGTDVVLRFLWIFFSAEFLSAGSLRSINRGARREGDSNGSC
jgi:hypothetical protein